MRCSLTSGSFSSVFQYSSCVLTISSSNYINHEQGNRRSHFARAVHSHHPRLCRSLLQRTRYTALSLGKKNHETAPSPWNFVTLPEDRATAIGNMHRKIGKDRACGSRDILADRQTDRHRQTFSTQYFSTAPAGKVIMVQPFFVETL